MLKEKPAALKHQLHTRSMPDRQKSKTVQLDLSLHSSPGTGILTHVHKQKNRALFRINSKKLKISSQPDAIMLETVLNNTDTNALPRLLAHHNPLGTLHPPVDLSLCPLYPPLLSLSHLLYRQAENEAGLSAWHSTSLPMSCLPHSVSLLSFFFSLSLSLSPPPSFSTILVSLITIQQTVAVESAERDDTQYLKAGTGKHHLFLSPPPSILLPFSAWSFSLWLVLHSSTDTAKSSLYVHSLHKHSGNLIYTCLSV